MCRGVRSSLKLRICIIRYIGHYQDYKYRKSHADMPSILTVVLSVVQPRKNQLSTPSIYYRKSIHHSVSIFDSTSYNGHERAVPLSKYSTKIISSCMFVNLPSLRVQFRVVFGTRIFERPEEDPTYIQKQRRTKIGNYDCHLQPKE